MKMLKKMLWASLMAEFVVMLVMIVSCKNGMQELVYELGDMLVVQKDPEPGSDSFDPNVMLSDKYLVSNDATLCLSAPNAEYYNWRIYRMISAESFYDGYSFVSKAYEEIKIDGAIPGVQKNFMLYMPDYYEILTSGTYRIVLTVGGADGNEYVDSCALIIYEPCYDIGDINLPS